MVDYLHFYIDFYAEFNRKEFTTVACKVTKLTVFCVDTHTKMSAPLPYCISTKYRAAKRYATLPCRCCSHLANASEAAPSTASTAFRPLPVAVYGHADHWVYLPAWGFLLGFYNNHRP